MYCNKLIKFPLINSKKLVLQLLDVYIMVESFWEPIQELQPDQQQLIKIVKKFIIQPLICIVLEQELQQIPNGQLLKCHLNLNYRDLIPVVSQEWFKLLINWPMIYIDIKDILEHILLSEGMTSEDPNLLKYPPTEQLSSNHMLLWDQEVYLLWLLWKLNTKTI